VGGNVVAEFVQAARLRNSIDCVRNPYVGFGFLWGLAGDLAVFGRPGAVSSVTESAMFAAPFQGWGHLPLVAALPLLMAWVFGTMGTVRWQHAEHRRRTLVLLDREVRHRSRSLRDMYLQAVLSLSSAIEAKNHYTHGHCRRVHGFAQAAAVRLGVSEQEREVLEYACYLHDIGKIGLPDAILDKPGRLTESEYAAVQEHSVRGEAILAPITGFEHVSALVRQHHERLDGSGYPDGLTADEIPLLARIIAVADSLDAMVSDRPYRRGMPLDEALTELRRCSMMPFDRTLVPGRDREARNHFDPRVVDAVLEALEEGLDPAVVSGDGPLPRTPQRRLPGRPNCWELQRCGAEMLTEGDPGYCTVPHAELLDGVNGGVNGGRVCWSVLGARCCRGDTASPPGGAEACLKCGVLAQVRMEEGALWFQLAPQIRDLETVSLASVDGMPAARPGPHR